MGAARQPAEHPGGIGLVDAACRTARRRGPPTCRPPRRVRPGPGRAATPASALADARRQTRSAAPSPGRGVSSTATGSTSKPHAQLGQQLLPPGRRGGEIHERVHGGSRGSVLTFRPCGTDGPAGWSTRGTAARRRSRGPGRGETSGRTATRTGWRAGVTSSASPSGPPMTSATDGWWFCQRVSSRASSTDDQPRPARPASPRNRRA